MANKASVILDLTQGTLRHPQAIHRDDPYYRNIVIFNISATLSPPGITLLEMSCLHSKGAIFIPMLWGLAIIAGQAGIKIGATALAQLDPVLKATRQLSATLTKHMQTHTESLMRQQHDSLAQMDTNNLLVQHFLLAGWDRICSVEGTSCRVYINNSGQAQGTLQRVLKIRRSYVM